MCQLKKSYNFGKIDKSKGVAKKTIVFSKTKKKTLPITNQYLDSGKNGGHFESYFPLVYFFRIFNGNPN
uniref:Uncharacterized protein n=1 Tax=Megaselia scalaris TaxID=36166 RepID=T1GY17_MEGSC